MKKSGGVLGGVNLKYTTFTRDGTGQPANQVVAQVPSPAEQTAAGGTIVVFVSSGR